MRWAPCRCADRPHPAACSGTTLTLCSPPGWRHRAATWGHTCLVGREMCVPGAHQLAHERYPPPRIRGARFLWRLLRVGGTCRGQVPSSRHRMSHTPSPCTPGRAGCCAAVGGAVSVLGSPLPSCTQGLLRVLGLMAGRGIAGRAHHGGAAAQVLSPGPRHAALGASSKSHRQPLRSVPRLPGPGSAA